MEFFKIGKVSDGFCLYNYVNVLCKEGFETN